MTTYDPLSRPQVGPYPYLSEGYATTLAGFSDPEDPSIPDASFWQLAMWWEPIRACLEGTSYLRTNCHRYLPQQPRELDDAYRGRVSRSVFSPYFGRLARTAVGLILRKPIHLEGGDETFWEEWRLDCDRQGTDLDEFVRNQLFLSVAYGHSSWLVDFPDAKEIRTLKDQFEADLKPYFVQVDPWSVIGWRQDPRKDAGKLQQVRIKEVVSVPKGRFGNEYRNRIRVLEPGKWEVWEEKDDIKKWEIVEQGVTSLRDIPMVTTYSNKVGTLFSKPPLTEIAQLNLSHYARHADLIQALHIAAQPILVLKGWDEQSDPVGLSVNNALAMPPEGDAMYVEPASSAFDAQRAELEALVEEMSMLGLVALTKQKNVAESGISKTLDRIDANSMLAIISKDIEQTLQVAINLAAEYAGIEAPVVAIDRDFNTEPMKGQEITAINTLFTSGLLDQQTALQLLQRGEVFDDSFDVEEILANAEAEQLKDMEQQLQRQEAQMELSSQYQEPMPANQPFEG
jgi:hypothetical protein